MLHKQRNYSVQQQENQNHLLCKLKKRLSWQFYRYTSASGSAWIFNNWLDFPAKPVACIGNIHVTMTEYEVAHSRQGTKLNARNAVGFIYFFYLLQQNSQSVCYHKKNASFFTISFNKCDGVKYREFWKYEIHASRNHWVH